MSHRISSSVSPTDASPIAWPQHLTNAVKALWRIALRPSSGAITAATVAVDKPVLLTLRASLPADRADVLCLTVEGTLSYHTYTLLIETANQHYQQGRRYLLLDLRQTTRIELSGLFALYNVARLYSNQSLLDSEAGWAGLHHLAEDVTPALGERVKLLAPSPVVIAALERASFCRFLDHYADLEAALAAFPLA